MSWGRKDWDAVVADGLDHLAAGLTNLLAPDGWTRVDLGTALMPSVLLLRRHLDDVLVGTLEVDQTSFAGPNPFPFTLTADLGVGLGRHTPAFAFATMEPIHSQLHGPSAPFEIADRHGFDQAEGRMAEFVMRESKFFGGIRGPADVDSRLRAEVAARLAAGDESDRDRAHYLALLRLLLLSGFASREVLLDVVAEYDGLTGSESGDEFREFAQSLRSYYAAP